MSVRLIATYRFLGSRNRDGKQPPAAGRVLRLCGRALRGAPQGGCPRGVGPRVSIQLVAHKADQTPAGRCRDAQLPPAPPPPPSRLSHSPLFLLPAGEGPARRARGYPRRPPPPPRKGMVRAERRREPRRRPQEPPQCSHCGSCPQQT